MFLLVAKHTQVDANRTGNEVRIRITTGPTIHRTGVHTTAAADTLQQFPMVGISNPVAPAVIHQHDMHVLCGRTRLTEMRSERGCRLTRTCPAEHTLEDRQTVVVGNHLLQADGNNMQFRTRSGHIRISFIGTYHDIARFCYTEVRARHSRIGSKELVAQTQSCHISQVGRIMVSLFRSELFFKQLAHIVMVQVDGRHHDMTRCLSFQLDDAFTQIGLHHLNAMFLQIRIHLALLGEHRLTLHDLLHLILLEDAIDNLVELLGILRPVNNTSVLLGIGGELIQILIQMTDGVAFDLRSLLPQLLPLLQSVGHIISLGANRPERGVVPARIFLVLQKRFRCVTMCCTHIL